MSIIAPHFNVTMKFHFFGITVDILKHLGVGGRRRRRIEEVLAIEDKTVMLRYLWKEMMEMIHESEEEEEELGE